MVRLGGFRSNIVPFSFLGIQEDYENSNYVLIGVPYDSTSSWMPGSRTGPLAVIEASRYMDPYDVGLGCIPAEAGLHTIPELSVMGLDPERMVEIVRRVVSKVRNDGKVPVLLGGEHTLSLGGVMGIGNDVEAFVVLDAHADFYDSYEGRRVSHATVSKRVSELVGEVLIYGVRTLGWEEKEELESSNGAFLTTFPPSAEAAREFIERMVGKKIYLSVDVDVLDPSILPCLGTPEPGGPSYLELLSMLKRIFRIADVLAMDFVEFSPCPGMRSDAYTVARLVYRSIGYHVLNSGYQHLGCSPDDQDLHPCLD